MRRTNDLFDRDGNLVGNCVTDTESVPAGIVWGVRVFTRGTDGRYVEVTSVDQPVILPANIPPPSVGAVN